MAIKIKAVERKFRTLGTVGGRRVEGEERTDQDPTHRVHPEHPAEEGAGRDGHPDYLLRPQRRRMNLRVR